MTLLRWLILISTSLTAFVTGSFFTYLILVNNNSSLSNDSIISGVFSGFGSLLGGLVGGIVAFGIARSQFIFDKSRDEKHRKLLYLNLLRALKNELVHNKDILNILESSNGNRDEYIHLLDTEVWSRMKYDNSNFLPLKIYTVLDEQNREICDFKEGHLKEYNDLKEIDFSLRLKVIDKLLLDIEKEENKHQNSRMTLF